MFVPYCASWRDLQHRPSWSPVRGTKREAAPRRTWLLLLCPAPGRHQAPPSHFNYGWHCLKTRREKATHRFYGEAHTHYLEGFMALKLFPLWRRGFIWYGAEMHCDTRMCTQQVGKKFRHWRGLEHLTCLRCFQRQWVFPCCCPLNVTQMCHQSICVKPNKRLFVSHGTWHLPVPPLPARASPLLKKIPDFCWLRLWHEDNSQTAGWRWTQPAQSSLLPSYSLPVCLSYCQADSPLSAVVFSPFALDNWVMPEL